MMKGCAANTRRSGGAEAIARLGVGVVLVALALLVWALLVSTAIAHAATGHRFLAQLTEAPGGTSIVEPDALTVERSSGRLFVADGSRGEVDVFSSTGAYETQFGSGSLFASAVAVDEQTGEVYVATGLGVEVYKRDGASGYELLSEWSGANAPHEPGEGGFGEVTGVAVDNSKSASDPHAGDVYVVDGLDNTVDVFKPRAAGAEEAQEGTFVAVLSGGGLEEPNGVAVDSATANVYVADSSKGIIDVWGPSDSFEKVQSKLTGAGSPQGGFSGQEEEQGNVSAVAVDETTGEIYVAEGERRVLSQFNAEGQWIGWVTNTPSGPLDEPAGVAVAPNGDVDLADAAAHLVDIFGPDVIVPDAKTNPATKVARTTAILNGTLNGYGKPAAYRFQWGQSEALGSETETKPAGSGEEKISNEVTSLKAASTYFFRFVTENEDGVNYGAIREFTTSPPVEDLTTGPAEDVTSGQATLTGALNPGGIETHYYFQWGKTSTYGSATPQGVASTGKEAVSGGLSGLQPNTIYHYRLAGKTNSASPTAKTPSSRRPVRPGSPTNPQVSKATKLPRSTSASTPTSCRPATSSNTAKRPPTEAKSPPAERASPPAKAPCLSLPRSPG